MTQSAAKDGFFCQEMLARRNEFADSVAWLQTTLARGTEKGNDLPLFFKDPTLPGLHDEVRELAEALQNPKDKHHIKQELGDVVWWVFAVCEAHGLQFRDVVDSIAERWITRRAVFETKLVEHGHTLTTAPKDVCRTLWAETKKELKAQEEAQ